MHYERNNRLGQVKSGKKFWADGSPVAGQQFEYGFDDIGNRTATKAGGDENGANLRSASYTPNLLNQYTSRTVPGAVDIMGVSFATNTVTVNGQAAYRKGEYFRKELPIANTAGPVWTNITVSATGQGSTNGYAFLPRTPEQFWYDTDGNLTNDGRWKYTWDAENRLVRMVSGTTTGPQQRLDFGYDSQGRRITRKVWNNTAGSGTPALDERFVYDGWNLAAELNATNNAVVRGYVWGLDLSGSMQGAGGVGGLLAVADPSNGTNFCCFDGNGNVSVLVSATNASTTAQYEYGPFGEVIRATGPMAKANPFRFSTKYQDDETDLLYYGYRYYNASTGRWISRDPMCSEPLRSSVDGTPEVDAGSDDVAEYVFVLNRPIGSTDWLGLLSTFQNCTCCQIDALRNHAISAMQEISTLNSQIGSAIAQVHQNPSQYPWHTEYKLRRALNHVNKAALKIISASVVCDPSTTGGAIAKSMPYGSTITVYGVYWWYIDIIQNATLVHEATHMASATTDAAYFWQHDEFPHDTFWVPWQSIASTYDSWIIEGFVIPRDNLYGPPYVPGPFRSAKECP